VDSGAIDDPHRGARDFHCRWPTLKPPLRPHPRVAETVAALLPDSEAPVLLLGVTPELAALPAQVVAVDWSARMIRLAWPGDGERRWAVQGDWRALPLAAGSVAAAIGDGCITMLRYPDDVRLLFDQLRLALGPGGRAVIRCFATPEPAETLAEVRAAAFSGETGFHAFKQRLNMATAHESGSVNVASEALFDSFERLFPDREALSRASGWSLEEIAEIDAYRGSIYIHCYPSRSRLLALVPDWMRGASFVETDGYPLAERCPLLVLDFP
jgi:SAM-dependent methyltransferase